MKKRLFCRGGLDDTAKSPGSLVLLAASVSISWVFAKSIQNVSTLGASYGLVGCAAYGKSISHNTPIHLQIYMVSCQTGPSVVFNCLPILLSCPVCPEKARECFLRKQCAAAAYYTSFASVGIVIYILRTRKGYRSLPEAINDRYGPLATLSFGAHSKALPLNLNARAHQKGLVSIHITAAVFVLSHYHNVLTCVVSLTKGYIKRLSFIRVMC